MYKVHDSLTSGHKITLDWLKYLFLKSILLQESEIEKN